MSNTGRFQAIVDRVERESLLAAKRAIHALRHLRKKKTPQKTVVFVGGIQRSGTNLMIDVLERSIETDVFHERDSRAFQDFQMRPPEVIRHLLDASKAQFVVIKALCELQDLRKLLGDFAPAKAIWMVRDYNDMVNSHMKLWSGCPETIGQIVEERNSAGWRGRGMSDATHALVSNLHHSDVNDASAVALFWYFRNILFFEQGFDADDRVLPVRYEWLVTNPHKGFRRAFDFVGIQYSPRTTAKVFTGSIRKAPPPNIEPRIRELCDSLVARFEPLLAS